MLRAGLCRLHPREAAARGGCCPPAVTDTPRGGVCCGCRAKNDKRTLYVGGLDDDVDVAVLRAAFIPFGEV